MRRTKLCKSASTQILLICVAAMVTPLIAIADLVKLDTNVGFDSVYLLEAPDAPTVTVALTFLAGEVDVEGPEGLSHYLEHLMFWHADNVADQQIHARGGNAWVNGLVTSYYNEGEKSDLDDMLEFARRLLGPPELDKDFMLRERSVVAREYDLRVSENPDWRIQTNIRRDLYDNLPVSRSVIGTPESIHSLTLAQAYKFRKQYYHPANAVLFISGNLDREEAKVVVNSHFAGIKPGQRHAAQWRTARIKKTSDTAQKFADSQVNYERLKYLTLSEWPDSENATNNWYTLWFLHSVLDSALEGGIARPLRMDNFVLRSFNIGLTTYLKDYFELVLHAEPDKDVTLEQASKAITETFAALASSGIPDATFERVRSRILQTEYRKNKDNESHYSRMSRQLSSGLSPVTSSEHIEHIKKVSLSDVNDLLRALANPKRRSIAFITPTGE